LKAHDDIQDEFPNLSLSDYTITSCATPKYNCVSWAVGDIGRKWVSGAVVKGYYWPPGVGDDDLPDQWAEIFRRHGYEETDDRSYEVGFEKIAIYADSEGASHVARQIQDGKWSSKLGNLSDIEHAHLEVLEETYGKVDRVMKRHRKDWEL
jgi:hypothetical protein